MQESSRWSELRGDHRIINRNKNRTPFVDENNLPRNISSLRKALGEGTAEHKYIVTLPGEGYRFVAEVRQLDAPTGSIRFSERKTIGSTSACDRLREHNDMIIPNIVQLEMALTSDRIILPMMETSGSIWVLENIDR